MCITIWVNGTHTPIETDFKIFNLTGFNFVEQFRQNKSTITDIFLFIKWYKWIYIQN